MPKFVDNYCKQSLFIIKNISEKKYQTEFKDTNLERLKNILIFF